MSDRPENQFRFEDGPSAGLVGFWKGVPAKWFDSENPPGRYNFDRMEGTTAFYRWEARAADPTEDADGE